VHSGASGDEHQNVIDTPVMAILYPQANSVKIMAYHTVVAMMHDVWFWH
jgi:hypothetical protein